MGLDYYYSIATGRIIRRSPTQPIAIETILGWIICGPNVKKDKSVEDVTTALVLYTEIVTATQEDILRQEIRNFWKIEGINEEHDVYEQFKEDITFEGKRYVTSLPFKPNHDALPDNYRLSLNRLNCLKKKLCEDEKLRRECIFKSYEQDGIIKLVDHKSEAGKVHYLPHRPVIRNDRETTKVRIVYDGSAKLNGPSLNDCLYTGPCLLNCIFGILLRWRMYCIGLISDIKQAFLNIGIREEHQDYLRFLWYDDVNSKNPRVIVFKFLRVLFGLTCSPFILNGTISTHMLSYEKENYEFT